MTEVSPIPTLAPVSFEIEAAELRLIDEHGHIVHLVENDDLSVVLSRGNDATSEKAAHIPVTAESTGYVVVSLGVDGDHDEVHFYDRGYGTGKLGAEEVLGQALESLATCREALRRVRRGHWRQERKQ